MTLTKTQRKWLKDIKHRCKRDWEVMLCNQTRYENDGKEEGYKMWESWRLADLCERLANVGYCKYDKCNGH
jgi:hypothetical protein